MRVERSGSRPSAGAAEARISPYTAEAVPATGAGAPGEKRTVSVGAKSVACGGARSAYLIAGGHPAAIRVQRPKDQTRHDSSCLRARGRQAGAWYRQSGGAVASTRGCRTALVRQDELDLRSSTHSPTAVCARWSIHSLHSSAIGTMAGRQHRSIGQASRWCLTQAAARAQVNGHE